MVVFISALVCMGTWGYHLAKYGKIAGLTLHTIFFVFFMSVPAIVQLNYHYFPWLGERYPDLTSVLAASFIIFIYGIFFSAGYSFRRGRYRYILERSWGINNVFLVIMVLISFIPVLVMIKTVGIQNFFDGRGAVGDVIYDSDADLAMLYAASKFGIFSALLVELIVNFFIKPVGWKALLHKSLLGALVIINIVVNGPQSSPRFHFLGMTIAILMTVGWLRSRVSNVILFILSPLFLYFVFPWSKTIGSGSYELGGDAFDYIKSHVDFDSFLMIANGYSYVSDSGVSLGLNFLGGMAFFVPRFIWLDKPLHLGALSADYVGYQYNNLSAPLPIEIFYSGSWLFLAVGAFFFGRLLSFADRIYAGGVAWSGVTWYGVSIILISFLFILLRGAFGAVAPVISLALFVFSIMSFFGFKEVGAGK
ncbi:hypothetical protein [Cupriavidus sp. WS]|uniref:hypothetical protein n=1 Tax=Cupriavidus sp. WS TaxID=1312922 RepID=UPI0012DE2773|nr:hypothetical protein [Cupriavidus sp. WS]